MIHCIRIPIIHVNNTMHYMRIHSSHHCIIMRLVGGTWLNGMDGIVLDEIVQTVCLVSGMEWYEIIFGWLYEMIPIFSFLLSPLRSNTS